MDLAKIIVDQSQQLWSGTTWTHCAMAFILLWAAVYKLAPIKNQTAHEAMEYMGLIVIVLVTALAFAYGGWIGLGALAFVIAVR